MKCNLPKPTKPRDMERLHEELCKIRCCKCGAVIEKRENPIFVIYEETKRKRLCNKCKGVQTDERED